MHTGNKTEPVHIDPFICTLINFVDKDVMLVVFVVVVVVFIFSRLKKKEEEACPSDYNAGLAILGRRAQVAL